MAARDPDPPTHAELVRGASGGDAPSIDRLVAEHLPGLLAYVRARAGQELRAHEATLDLAQSACREVLEDIEAGGVTDEAGFRAWLYRAAASKIADRLRYLHREKRDVARNEPLFAAEDELACYRRGVSGFFTPSADAIAREELGALDEALRRLPEDYREVILLTRIVGLDYARVAEEMGRTPAAIRVLVHRAIGRLAREMGGDGD